MTLITLGRMPRLSAWIGVLAVVGLITEIIAVLIFRTNNFPVYNIYMLIEYGIIAYIYYSIFSHSDAKRLIVFLTLIFLIFAFLGLLFFDGWNDMNSVTMMLKSFILSGYAIFSFQQLTKNIESNHFKDPVFYFSSGVLIYFVGNLFTFGYGQRYFSDPESFPFDIWDIHAVFNIIFNLSLALSIWFGREKITTSSS